jgi:nitrogen fixation/metabolism regulation signal transduction histidine kinase
MEDDVKAQLYQELHHVLLWLEGFSALFLLAAAVFGIVLSHRTAGPMYQFKRVFREIISGKAESRIRLRPKDDFADVADLCNQMIEYLQKKP